jgi:adenosine deaminase
LATGLGPLIAAAQKQVIEHIRRRGVVVEINPSSNLRMGRIARLSEAPYLNIIDALGADKLVTINTDNPGVYRTRIELEYALVYKGLRDRGRTRPECLAMLETIRQTGMSVVY